MPKARKKSTDPVQEALRQHKVEWRDAQKEFVAYIMGLKNGINGRGDNRFGIPPSNIKDPLPGEVSSLLNILTSQFQSLVGGANAIIEEQRAYSQTRRKKQEKGPKGAPNVPAGGNKESTTNPSPPTPAPNSDAVKGFLSNVAATEPMLEKQASNKLTRMWQYIKAPFSKDDFVTKRTSLLSSAAEIYYGFLDLENAILSLNDDSIPLATAEFYSIHNSLNEFKRTLNEDVLKSQPALENNINERPEQGNNPSSFFNQQPASASFESTALPPKNEIASVIQEIHAELHAIISSSLPLKKEIIHISNLITQFRNAEESKDLKLASELFKEIDRKQTELKMMLSTMIDQEPDEKKREKLKKIIASSDLKNEEIVKISHNYITRLLKKHWVGLQKSNKTSFHRLNISKRIGIIKKILQQIMDSLEKTINVKFLDDQLKLILEETGLIQKSIRILNLIHQSKMSKEYGKPSKNNPNHRSVMDSILQNEFRKNIKNVIF